MHHRIFFQIIHPILFNDYNPNPMEGDQRVMLLVFHPISIIQLAFQTNHFILVALLFIQLIPLFIQPSLLFTFHPIIFKIKHHRVNCPS